MKKAPPVQTCSKVKHPLVEPTLLLVSLQRDQDPARPPFPGTDLRRGLVVHEPQKLKGAHHQVAPRHAAFEPGQSPRQTK